MSTLSRSILFLAAGVLFSGCASTRSLRAPAAPVSRVDAPDFRQAIGSILGADLREGNRITTLENGDRIFSAMLAGIRSARRTITFETYIFEKSDIAEQFATALAERARAGVKVHAIIDAHGGKKGRRYFSTMRDAGVELAVYHRLLHWDPRRYNNRTHRKLLVIDGKIGFIGGVGIADLWTGNAQSPEHWRDLHYRVEGPVVAQLQAAFLDNWLKTHEEILHGPAYFPALPKAGSAKAAVFHSSPRKGAIKVVLMYQLAIASARESLQIENAYFVPDDHTVEALVAAARRGVRVEIIVPGRHIDQKSVRRASRRRWRPLLEAGVKFFEYQPTMVHTKLLIADGFFTSVGSANFDNRSMRLNDEANLNVLDRSFASEQSRIFARDRAQSREVTLESLKNESAAEAPLQALHAPLESQL